MIFEKVRTIIAEQLGEEESKITLGTDFKEDLDSDSLDLFQIISEIEDEFDVKIEETDELKTVGDVVKLIEAQIEKE